MSDWDDDISESNEHASPLSTSPSSDMFTSQQLRAASPPALSSIDGRKVGSHEGSSSESVKTESVEEVDIDPPVVVDPVALDSFLPLLEALDFPGLKLINGAYYLRGAIPEDSSRKLSEYARRVTKFTLGKTAPEARIDAATWFRVLELRSRLSQSSTAFFPSLTEVCINGADSSLDQIFLLLSPSLESVNVYNVPQTRSDTLLAFLETVAEVAPSLSHIGVDTSLAFRDVQQTYIKFSGLRSLRISINGGSHFSYDTLLRIGQLLSLEALILDASAAYYYAREEEYPDPQAQLSLKAPSLFHGGWGASTLFPPPPPSPPAFTWGEPSTPSSPHPRSPSPAPSIPSAAADVPSSPQQPVLTGSDGVAPLNEGVKFQNLTKLHIKGQLELMTELVQMGGSSTNPYAKKKGKGGLKVAVVPLVQNPFVGCFEDILEEVLSAWGHSLNAVYIALDDTTTTNPSTISSALFKRLISTPSLERLELSGHTLDADFGDALHVLTALPVERRPKFKVIHLPIDAGDKGISFNRLRTIFECCPSLVSFQCGFKHLSNVPALPSDGVTFGLQELGAGSPKAYGDQRRLAAAAQYLDALFPRLSVMKTEASCNAGEWEEIYDLVRMCQTSRSYHKYA